jgi:hypothetical protein
MINFDMQDRLPRELRTGPLKLVVDRALVESIGPEHAKRVKFYINTPKGLFRDGAVHIGPGERQTITIYGLKAQDEQDRLVSRLKNLLQERGRSFAPVLVRFFDAEKFRRDDAGRDVRAGERLLRQEFVAGSLPIDAVTRGQGSETYGWGVETS